MNSVLVARGKSATRAEPVHDSPGQCLIRVDKEGPGSDRPIKEAALAADYQIVTPELHDGRVPIARRLIRGRYLLYALIMTLAAVSFSGMAMRAVWSELALLAGAVTPSLVARSHPERRLVTASVLDVVAAFAFWVMTGEPVLTILIVLWGMTLTAFVSSPRARTSIVALAMVLELVKAPLMMLGGAYVAAVGSGGPGVDANWMAMLLTAISRALVVLAGYLFLRSIARLHTRSMRVLLDAGRRHREVLEHSPVPIVVLAAGSIQYANEAACGLLGGPEHALLGRDLARWVIEEDRPVLARTIAGADTGNPAQEVTIQAAAGERHVVDVTAVPMNFDGSPSIHLTLVDVTERVLAEQALSRSEAWFRSAFVDSATPFGLFDFNGVLIGTNGALSELLDAEEEEIIGTSWRHWMHEEDAGRVLSLMAEVHQGGGDRFSVVVQLFGWGADRWVHLNVGLLRDEDGVPSRFFGQLFDITQRIEAEEAKLASEARYAQLFERLPVALYRTAKDGTIVDGNPALAQLLGHRSVDELIGLNARDAYAERGKRDEFVEAIFDERRLVGHEIELLTNDGERIWVQDSGMVVEHRDGMDVIEGVLVNVTGQVEAERALRSRVDQQQAVARLGHVALTSGTDTLVQEAAEAVASLLDASVVGVFRSEDAASVRLAGGVGFPDGTVGELVIDASASGHLRHVLGSPTPVITDSFEDESRYEPSPFLVEKGVRCGTSVRLAGREATFGFLGVWSESRRSFTADDLHLVEAVANLLAAAYERQQARTRLEQLMRSKDEFVASVSHELRTPLTVVNGMAHELTLNRERFSPEEVDEFIALIAEQSSDMANLIEDLLVSARADIGKVTVTIARIDLAEAVAGLMDSLQPAGDLETDLDAVWAWVDPTRLRQILRNLVTNARRYGAAPITIRVRRHGDEAVVAVTDCGTGIPAGDRELIFEPYQRAHHTVGVPASVGLGLTVSRTLAELMDGTLTYHHDGESVFELRLPAAPSIADDQPVTARVGDLSQAP